MSPHPGFNALVCAVVATSMLGADRSASAAGTTATRAGKMAAIVVLNDNGAWSWFEDERAVIDRSAGLLLVSSVAHSSGTGTLSRWRVSEVAGDANRIYHGVVDNGQLLRSDGTIVDSDLFDNAAVPPARLTTVFADRESGPAWTVDLAVDSRGHAYAAFSVRVLQQPLLLRPLRRYGLARPLHGLRR